MLFRSSQASPRGEAKDSALLPSRDADILVPPEWPEIMCSFPVVTGILGLHTRLTRGISPCLEWKQRTPLSSRIATGISWSPLNGLKGDKPPVEFGERTRDCSPCHSGKEGPHLAMMAASRGFSICASPHFLPSIPDSPSAVLGMG